MLVNILSLYNIQDSAVVEPFGTGLINHTWMVKDGTGDYILQKINHNIFKEPKIIAANIEAIAGFLSHIHPEYLFVTPLKTINGESMVYMEDTGYFRLFPFVKKSHTVDVADTPGQAFEAARQFGLFTKVLETLPADSLKITLPDFHNLAMRYEQFNIACLYGNPSRIADAHNEIAFLQQQDHIVTTYKAITASPDFKLRVTHHDTKISNVLFDGNDQGICVIDLDTVMPGYFISDVGDMMRTYLSPVSEEEKNYSKIKIREAYFEAIVQGYLGEMADELTCMEIDHFVYAGMFLIYMQAIRFLTDHLNDDKYYGAAYTGQNYVRAQNQIALLQQLMDKEAHLKQIVNDAVDKQLKKAATL